MQIVREYLVVKVPSIFIDESRYTGVDDRKIIMFVYQNPEQHIRNHGIVVSVPLELPRLPLIPQYVGAPAYYDQPRIAYKRVSDIRQEILVGDKVIFHWNCLLPDKNEGSGSGYNKQYMFSEKEMVNGQEVNFHYFKIKYQLVHAVIRYHAMNAASKPFEWYMEDSLKKFQPIIDQTHKSEDRYIYTDLRNYDHMYRKEVQMIGSWTFVTPDVESWEDISIPTPETVAGRPLVNEDGSIRMKPKDQWMVMKSQPGDKYLRGWISHIGSPLHGDEPVLCEGMYVYFRPLANTKIRFEGKDYFRLYQRHIVAYEPLRARAIA